MTFTQELFWFCVCLVGVGASGLLSGLETGIYSLNRVRLHLKSDEGDKSARVLYPMVRKPERLLATLLIGTNIANNLATSATGILLESNGLSMWQIVVANVLIVTPVLFIFAETLPKDLFAAHADRLVYPFSRPIRWMSRLFTWVGILPLIDLVSAGINRFLMPKNAKGEARKVNPFHPRLQIQMLVKEEGVGMGLLSDMQSELIERVLTMKNRTVGDEMVPWTKVVTVTSSASPTDIWELAQQQSRSRYPLIDESGDVAGVVNLYEVLLHTPETCPPLMELADPVLNMKAELPLREGLSMLRHAKVALAIVVDNDDTPVGIVSMKDLVEPITGELISW